MNTVFILFNEERYDGTPRVWSVFSTEKLAKEALANIEKTNINKDWYWYDEYEVDNNL